MKWKSYPFSIWALCVLNICLAVCAFALDLNSETSLSFAPLYTVIVLFSWILPKRFTVLMVALSMFFAIYGISNKFGNVDTNQTVMINGFVGVLSIAVTYFLVMAARNSTGELRKTNAKLNQIVERRTEELVQKVSDLESHKSLLEESKELLTIMQSELKKSEQKYQLMIEKIQDYSILLIDKSGKLASWNIGAQNLWGYDKKEVNGQSFTKMLNNQTEDTVNGNQILELAYSNDSVSIEGARTTAKGQKIYTQDNFSAIKGANQELLGYTWVTQNLTEQKKKEEEIVELNKSLEEKVQKRTKDLESFVYSVSHDLRAPLRAVAGFTQILSEHLKEMEHSEEIDRYIGFISENSSRMSRLIDDLLAFSKFGNQAVNKTWFDMPSLIDVVHREITIQYPEYSTYNLTLNGDFKQVFADENLIKQVVVNFISNAFKYSSNEESPSLTIHFTENAMEYQLCFEDNGAGFDSKYVEKLFKVFQRLHDGSEFEGTGIGLAIVKQIIDNHRGRVWAEGEEGVGAKFYFTLPIEAS